MFSGTTIHWATVAHGCNGWNSAIEQAPGLSDGLGADGYIWARAWGEGDGGDGVEEAAGPHELVEGQ